ncbi:MAG: isoleucine--tRNA ligase [Hyphomicrobiaceae bacterium]
MDTKTETRDWGATLFLPNTSFPMRAGLPQLEPKLLERWARLGLYGRQRAAAKGRPKFILHDGPPYANGNIHIGTALNKILKDMVTRSQQMLGFDSNYVPGWDCHGLPIEWKIEEQYRAKGQDKDTVPVNEFRRECREFAEHWIGVQMAEFKRLGVEGDWAHYYSTMAYRAEATIAAELMKFAMNGALYRGSKPVMWSVVEKTALAEAEVEYHDYTSDMVWVKFPVLKPLKYLHVPQYTDAVWLSLSAATRIAELAAAVAKERFAEDAQIVIWTTTPWTIPGNRAVSFSEKVEYGLYEVTSSPDGNWAKRGDRYVLAVKLAEQVMRSAKVEEFERLGFVAAGDLADVVCAHPLRDKGYDFSVPLLAGDHVTDEDGTGFVHTAPGHGREDFDVWMENAPKLQQRGIDTTIPFTVDGDGRFTKDAPGFEGKRVIDDKGNKGDANDAVIKALVEANALIARGRLKHQYPHSWRSKKPVIFRNTPQWFIAMDKPLGSPDRAASVPSPLVGEGQGGGDRRTSAVVAPPTPNPSPQGGGESARRMRGNQTLREVALQAIAETEFVPASGQNRLRGMIDARPDWVISRQRAWGVPITVFQHKETGEVIPSAKFAKSDELMARIRAAMTQKGADAWFETGAQQRFLAGLVPNPAEWEKVTDILDVWFDSGSTHVFTLEDPQAFPQLAGIVRVRDGGKDRVMYLEGSDQHRGWFQSSLLESCGTRGRAPFDVVLTHGFILDEKGEEKMSKSRGNTLSPQELMKTSGADILRLWVSSSDYSSDIRFGPAILQGTAEAYRKLRNTLRWMLGMLAHHEGKAKVTPKDMPELERLMLHRLAELDVVIREAYAAYDYKRVVSALSHFMNTDLSAFYVDIRKDALYCEPYSSRKRLAALETIEQIFRCTTLWLAPLMCFTAEEAWLARYPSEEGSVHLELFPAIPKAWRDDALSQKWEKIKRVRRVVTGALEIERAAKRIGSALEAAPEVYIADPDLLASLDGIDTAEVCITSGLDLRQGTAPAGAFTLEDVAGVAVVPKPAQGKKCVRSWRITQDVGSDPAFPDLSARDAAAVREFDQRTASAAR